MMRWPRPVTTIHGTRETRAAPSPSPPPPAPPAPPHPPPSPPPYKLYNNSVLERVKCVGTLLCVLAATMRASSDVTHLEAAGCTAAAAAMAPPVCAAGSGAPVPEPVPGPGPTALEWRIPRVSCMVRRKNGLHQPHRGDAAPQQADCPLDGGAQQLAAAAGMAAVGPCGQLGVNG